MDEGEDTADWIPPPPPLPGFYDIDVVEEEVVHDTGLHQQIIGIEVGQNAAVVLQQIVENDIRIVQLITNVNKSSPKGPCEHRSRKFNCRICNPGRYCPHDKVFYYCGPCGGAGICEHECKRSICRACGGASICEHDKHRSHCKICSPHLYCVHNKRRSSCHTCSPYLKCEHGHRRHRCMKCWAKGPFVKPERRSPTRRR